MTSPIPDPRGRRRTGGSPAGATDRRHFLCGGLAVIAAAAGGCASSSVTVLRPSPRRSAADDAAGLRVSAVVELHGVAAYDALLDAAARGELNALPPAFVSFATTARSHHTDHLHAVNARLATVGVRPQTALPESRAAALRRSLAAVRGLADAVQLLLRVETEAMATHTVAGGQIQDPATRLVALSIAPAEARHAAFLNLLSGRFPAPDSFLAIDAAATSITEGG